MRRWHLIVWLVGLLLPSLTLTVLFVIDLEEEETDLPRSDADRAADAVGCWVMLGSIPAGIILCGIALFAIEGSAILRFGLLVGTVFAMGFLILGFGFILILISFEIHGFSGMQ